MNILTLKKEDFPQWYFAKVQCPQDLDNFEFYHYDSIVYKEICTSDIIGTCHADYYHKAWLEMLSHLKRHKTEDNIEQIKNIILRKNDDKLVCEYNNRYYIVEGNHRLCQAKFLNLEKVYCGVIRYKFNYEDFNLYQELINNNFTCDYSDGDFRNIRFGATFISTKTKKEIEILINVCKTMRVSRIEKFFLSFKPLIKHLNFKGSEEDVKALKSIIILNFGKYKDCKG